MSDDPTPFAIDSEARAAWAADKVLAARERLARIKANCQAMIEAAQSEVESAESFFLPMLEAWAREHPPRRGKTIRLPTGALSFRTVPGGPRVVNEDDALDWAEFHLPAAVKVSKKVMASVLKEHYQATGELPPGVEVVPDDERFDVKG